VKTSYLRIEVARKDINGATLKLPAYEAIRIEGSLGIPQGMVTFEDFQTDGLLRDYGRVVYAPVIGVHSTGIFDTFDFRTSDCELWSPQDTQIAIVLDGPTVPSEFCKEFNFGTNDPVCMGQWMNYSKSFGHTSNPRSVFTVDPTNVKRTYQEVYIQPDVDFMVGDSLSSPLLAQLVCTRARVFSTAFARVTSLLCASRWLGPVVTSDARVPLLDSKQPSF
jgi:hypothetical protein